MKEINEQIIERYMLSIERIRRITEEETTEVLYRDFHSLFLIRRAYTVQMACPAYVPESH